MKDNSTTITNPATGEKKVFAYDHSYWSHDGYNVDPDGIFVSEPDHEPPYADQVQYTMLSCFGAHYPYKYDSTMVRTLICKNVQIRVLI